MCLNASGGHRIIVSARRVLCCHPGPCWVRNGHNQWLCHGKTTRRSIVQSNAVVDSWWITPCLYAFDMQKKMSFDAGEEVVNLTQLSTDSEQSEEPGVIYLGRIPHGMYEAQLRSYFTQFGDVTRVRLSRSKRVSYSFPLLHPFVVFSLSYRQAGQNPTPSSNLPRAMLLASWQKRCIIISLWDTSSSVTPYQKTKSIQSCGWVQIIDAELYCQGGQ